MNASPSRLLLFENGAAMGVFSSGGSDASAAPYEGEDRGRQSTVVLEPSGACFTQMDQDGRCHRHITDFCRRDLIPQVTAVFRFRNAHSSRPYVSRRIHAAMSAHERPGKSSSRSSSRRRKTSGRPTPRLALWPVVATTPAACGKGGGVSPAGPTERPPPRPSSTTLHRDGRIEVRATGGNARLTLSASRRVAEVDYAVAIPEPTDAVAAAAATRSSLKAKPWWEEGHSSVAWEGEKKALQEMKETLPAEGLDCSTTHTVSSTTSRVWVTRQFLVGPTPSDAPPAFSHALAVALEASRHPAAAAAAAAAADDGDATPSGRHDCCAGGAGASAEVVTRGSSKAEFVASELPLPEGRPDRTSWDTVQEASLRFEGDLEPLGCNAGGWRNMLGRGVTPPVPGYYHDTASANCVHPTVTETTTASRGLLSVDVMKLAEGRGFAGELAAVVESTGGCTYRVVVTIGEGDDRGDAGRGGRHLERVDVHVVVHADGTEVWLEGDFVRLLRSPWPRPRSLETVTQQQQQQQQRQRQRQRQRRRPAAREERFLHVSAASTIHFHVPSPPSPPRSASEEHVSVPREPAIPSKDRSRLHLDGSPAANTGTTASTSVCASAAADGGMSITSLSLGDIASRAMTLRRQFMAHRTSAAIGGASDTGTPQRVQGRPAAVRIRPPRVTRVPGGGGGGGGGVANTFLPRSSAPVAVRGVQPSTSAKKIAISHASSSTGETAASKLKAAFGASGSTCGAVVAELEERGGASFVAFADGRARGSFADRTIVYAGARTAYRTPLREQQQRLGSLHVSGGGGGGGGGSRFDESVGKHAGAAAGFRDLSGGGGHPGVPEAGSREIECIRPDGTVVRLMERSMGNRLVSTALSGVGLSRLGGLSGDPYDLLRPYVVAVVRFADWAAASPGERRAAKEREVDRRMVTEAEAERNRRFVELQRLAKVGSQPLPPTPRSPIPSCGSRAYKGTRAGWSVRGARSSSNAEDHRCAGGGSGGIGGGESGCGNASTPAGRAKNSEGQMMARRNPADRFVGEGADCMRRRRVGFVDDYLDGGDDNKENAGVTSAPPFFVDPTKPGESSRSEPRRQGARERNALVARLLEANRDVLIRTAGVRGPRLPRPRTRRPSEL